MKQFKISLIAIALIAFAASCKKDDSAGSTVPPITNGVIVLNQGTYGHNNTTLTYYDSATAVATTDYFKEKNNFSLGSGGSDITVYGGKIYVVMNGSANVAVMNAFTAAFIDTISFKHAGVNRGPENVLGASGKIFVSSTDGTVEVIDTATLAITNTLTVGTNPAQMAVSGSNLYVSNSGGYGNYDSTVSVIDISSLTVTGSIKVGVNPGSITADNSGNIYVACAGDYAAVLPQLVKVNTSSATVTKAADTAVSAVRFYNNYLYATPAYGGVPVVRILSTTDFSTVSNFVTDATVITNPYGLDISPANGDVYIDDAKDYISSGAVYCFNSGGVLKFSFTTGSSTTFRTQPIEGCVCTSLIIMKTKCCPRCEKEFSCNADSISICQCTAIKLPDDERVAIAMNYQDCLCLSCLTELKAVFKPSQRS